MKDEYNFTDEKPEKLSSDDKVMLGSAAAGIAFGLAYAARKNKERKERGEKLPLFWRIIMWAGCIVIVLYALMIISTIAGAAEI